MKKEMRSENKALLMFAFSFVCLIASKYILQYNSFFILNQFIFNIFYVIIALLLPALIVRFKLTTMPTKKDANKTKFIVFYSFGMNIVVELLYFYFFNSAYVTAFNQNDFDNFTETFIKVTLFSIIWCFYYTKLYKMLENRITVLYSIIFSSVFMALMSYEPIYYLLFGFIYFFIVTNFKNLKYVSLFVIISMGISYLFDFVYYIYSPFEINHYFLLIFAIFGFICILKTIEYAKTLAFKDEFVKMKLLFLSKVEMKILWIALLFTGIYILLY